MKYATCLADLVDDEFLVVATQERPGKPWVFLIPKSEVAEFQRLRGHGDITAPTRFNVDDRSSVILAKLARA